MRFGCLILLAEKQPWSEALGERGCCLFAAAEARSCGFGGRLPRDLLAGVNSQKQVFHSLDCQAPKTNAAPDEGSRS